MPKADIKRRELLAEIQRLDHEEQYKLLEDIVMLLKNRGKKKHDISELKGLGKELWESVDIDKYVERERETWNG
ncbi:MAG: hypothetical protein ACOC53_07315 [Candidatus Saliniplasma sp.]